MDGFFRTQRIGLLPVTALLLVILSAIPAAADAGPAPPGFMASNAQVNTQDHKVTGLLFVRGRDAETHLSIATEGCGNCSWAVLTVCQTNTGKSGPDASHCQGIYVGCRANEQRFQVLFSPSPGIPTRLVDSYCYAASDAGLVSGSMIAADARKYADQVQVTPPTLRSWPPGGATLVNLPTYFSAQAPQSAAKDFGGQGYTMRLQVGAAQYAWSFGDGASLETTDPGSAPPDGSVRHAYLAAGQQAVTASVAYGATFTVVTPFGSIGPTPVAGGPVRTVPARMDLRVQEAYASLTG